MSQFQLYSKVSVYINDSLLFEEADVRLTRNSGLMPVNTVAKGLAGFSVGAPFIDCEIGNAVPAAGFEYDPGPDMQTPNLVQLTLVCAGQQLVSKGAILNDDLSHAVNAESKMSFRWHGEFASWEAL